MLHQSEPRGEAEANQQAVGHLSIRFLGPLHRTTASAGRHTALSGGALVYGDCVHIWLPCWLCQGRWNLNCMILVPAEEAASEELH